MTTKPVRHRDLTIFEIDYALGTVPSVALTMAILEKSLPQQDDDDSPWLDLDAMVWDTLRAVYRRGMHDGDHLKVAK